MMLKFLQSTDSVSDHIPQAHPLDGTLLSGSDITSLFDRFDLLAWGSIVGFFSALWSVYVVFAYIISIVFLVLYVYASVKKNLYVGLQTQVLRDAEKAYDAQYRGGAKNSRLEDIRTHAASDNPNDWKLAIIESDIILDDLLKRRGYVGNSLGERLRSISPQQLSTLNDAWEAHKVRNRIAHDGADFVLTKRVAQETILQYQRVFNEFGIS